MKKIFATIATLAAVSVCFSQPGLPGKKFFFLSLSAGPSFPTEPFHTSNIQDNKILTTKTGYLADINCTYQLDEVFAVSADVFYAAYPSRKKDDHQPPELHRWQCAGMLAGPAMTILAGKKMYVTIKTAGGISWIKAPVALYTVSTASNDQTANTFAVQMGVDLNYMFRKNYFIFIHSGYCGMSPSFSSPGITGEKVTEEIQILNITTGVGIRL